MNLFTLIFAAVPVLVQYYARKYEQEDYEATLTELQGEFSVPSIKTYDFIVVGAGSAGCIVASRLSEHFTVLLLEAGGNPVPASDVPAFVNQVAYDRLTNYDFPGNQYTRVAQPRATGGIQYFSFGKMMGGSGSHNDMAHNRGSPYDYENWANITGDASWSYASVLQYFKKYEDFVGTLYEAETEANYGYGGPLKIDTDVSPILPVWFQAAGELGYRVGDPNGFQREGFHPMNMMMYNGQRVSSYKGFIKDIEATRANLTVLRYSDVQEILIDSTTKRAFGVEFLRHGIAQRALASKEVIVSGGVFRSPLLLQKSGIGPADVLADAGIEPKLIRPGVGRNLGDHVEVTLKPIYVNAAALALLPRINDGDEAEVERYKQAGEGVLGMLGEGPQAFFVSSRAKRDGEPEWPDISVTLDTTPNEIRPSEEESLNLYVVNARPKNRGWIALNGTAWREGERDDQKLSLIDFQLLGDPSDVDVLVEGIKLALSIVEDTAAFQYLGARFPPTPHEECLEFFYRSDAYWRCVIDWQAGNWLHLCGTNSMGLPDDVMAVVDTKLRVIGAEGLRVIDASVMPVVPNGNTNAPTLMVAEKGVDEILKEYLGVNYSAYA